VDWAVSPKIIEIFNDAFFSILVTCRLHFKNKKGTGYKLFIEDLLLYFNDEATTLKTVDKFVSRANKSFFVDS